MHDTLRNTTIGRGEGAAPTRLGPRLPTAYCLLPTGHRLLPTRSAFTLIEILAVVVILGIASAVIIPQLGTHDDLNVSSAARMVMADLIYAQNRAITTQSMHYVIFNSTANATTYSITTALPPAGNADYVQNPITKTNYTQTFGSSGTSGLQDVVVTTASFDGNATIAFDSLGTPYSCGAPGASATAMSAGSIVLTSSSGKFTLTITVQPYTGEISVQ